MAGDLGPDNGAGGIAEAATGTTEIGACRKATRSIPQISIAVFWGFLSRKLTRNPTKPFLRAYLNKNIAELRRIRHK